MSGPGRTLAAALLVGWGLCGCAGNYSYAVKAPAAGARGEVVYWETARPVAQDSFQCGPAALESVFGHWGHRIEAADIGRELHEPRTRGVLNFTLAQFAKERGFWTETPEADEAALKAWIRRGIPVIVMLDTGALWVRGYHYVVLKGFDEQERIFYANTGHAETQAIRYDELARRRIPAGGWCLVICPPEQVDWDLSAEEAGDMGLLCERAGKLDPAEYWYSLSLIKDPGNAVIRFDLANIYLKKKRFTEAEAVYRELLRARPDWTSAANNLAWTCLEQGRAGEAVTILEHAFTQGAEKRPDVLDTLERARREAAPRTVKKY